MKKTLPALILAALAIAAIAFGCAAVFSGNETLTVRQTAISPHAARDFVSASLTYDAGTRTLRGTQSILAENRTGEDLGETVMRLYMNSLVNSSVSVSGVKVNGESVPFSQDEDDPTVLRMTFDWEKGAQAEISFALMIKHAKAEDAAIITLPMLAVYEDGAWREDAYDGLVEPVYAQAFDFTLSVILPDSAAAAFGGALISARWETGVGETQYIAQMQNARDVSFALSSGKVRQREYDGVLLSTLAKNASAANKLLSRAQETLDALQAIGLPYPSDALSVVQCDSGRQDGVIRSGLIALSDDQDGETLRQRMTRLIARQTFGVSVGSDPWNAPWLSYALSSAAELLTYRNLKGEAAYLTRYFDHLEIASRLTRPYGVTVGASTAHFGGDAEMTQVLRDQGGAMLMGIGEAVGEDAFTDALVRYARENAGEIAAQQDLEAALYEATGSSWSGYLADELTF